MADSRPPSALTTIRAWVASRALGIPAASLLPVVSPMVGERKENPVGALVAQMWSPGSPVYTPISYEALAREGVIKNGYVYRAINIIARACGGIPWLLYREKGPSSAAQRRARGGKVNTQELDTHPLLDLLARPHGQDDIFGTASLIEQIVSYFILSGNSYLNAIGPTSRKGPPQELWVLRPDRMRIIPATTGGVATFRYLMGGKHVDFDPATILHWKAWNPSDDWYGLSPVSVAARIIDQMNAANDWNTALLQNMAKPGGFLVAPGNLSDPQFERLRLELQSKYQTAKNAGRPQVLEGGMTWQQVGLTPSDMDWLQGKVANVRELAVILGVPTELLGDSTNKTYSNYQEARRSFYTETVLPLMDILRDLLNAWLVPMFGDDSLRLDYDRDDIEALQEDRALIWQRAHDAYGGGIITLNEARDLLGYEKTQDGDVFIAPPRAMTLDQLLAGADFPKPPKPGGIPNQPPAHAPTDAPTPTPGAPGTNTGGNLNGPSGQPDSSADANAALDDATVKALVRAFVAWRNERMGVKALTDGSDGAGGSAPHVHPIAAARAPLEAHTARQVHAQMTSERDRLIKLLRAATHAGATPDTALTQALADLRSGESLAQWEQLFTSALSDIGAQAGEQLVKHWQASGLLPDTMSYDPLRQGSQIADALARGVARQQAQYTVNTTADDLSTQWQKQIATGIDASKVDNLISTLNDAYEAWQSGRVDSIASMQVVGGWELGQLDAAFAAQDVTGAKAVRTWNAVMDAHTRAAHADADGQQVGLGENFDVGGEPLMYPGDPSGSAGNVINCRCWASYDLALMTGSGDTQE